MLIAQGNKCALCGEDCSDDPVLDHNHKTGAIRAVLHRQCNSLLGRFENNGPRHGVKPERLAEFLSSAASYLNTHSSDQTGLVHPSMKTAEEKKALAKKKRAKRRREAKKLEE